MIKFLITHHGLFLAHTEGGGRGGGEEEKNEITAGSH